MLVLTQKEGEVLEVGDDIRIHIKRIKGNWVRLCIDAPPEVTLQRVAAAPEVEVAERRVRKSQVMPQVIQVPRPR